MNACRVGRIDLSSSELSSSSNKVKLAESLRDAYASGMKLIYLLAPPHDFKAGTADPLELAKFQLPGIITDAKTTYELPLSKLDASALFKCIYNADDDIRIRIEYKSPQNNNTKLRDLAVTSGEWSRFRVDTNIPTHVYTAIFEAWINNSVNRSIADEVFVASLASTGEDVGFLTVKRRGNVINIGLLAVDGNFR
jgi:dTDP-4-amino-4,6-dideoxy-D-galactose acyltransferase